MCQLLSRIPETHKCLLVHALRGYHQSSVPSVYTSALHMLHDGSIDNLIAKGGEVNFY